MAVQKQVRINSLGKIEDPDRQVHVSQEDGLGGQDKVKFRYVGTGGLVGKCTIHFGYLKGSPFGNDADDVTFKVLEAGETKTVDKAKPPGVYKYDVFETNNPTNVTDDPDVIVD